MLIHPSLLRVPLHIGKVFAHTQVRDSCESVAACSWHALVPHPPGHLLRSQSLDTVPVFIVWQYFPHDNIVCIHKYDEYMKSIDSGVCHEPWSIFVIDRASLITDHKTLSRPILGKYKHFRTN